MQGLRGLRTAIWRAVWRLSGEVGADSAARKMLNGQAGASRKRCMAKTAAHGTDAARKKPHHCNDPATSPRNRRSRHRRETPPLARLAFSKPENVPPLPQIAIAADSRHAPAYSDAAGLRGHRTGHKLGVFSRFHASLILRKPEFPSGNGGMTGSTFGNSRFRRTREVLDPSGLTNRAPTKPPVRPIRRPSQPYWAEAAPDGTIQGSLRNRICPIRVRR